jgi:phosphoadenosine phosphosulfate reductase
MSAVDLYARATEGFDARVAHAAAVLQGAAAEHAGRIVQATSLGAEDMVITDLIARHRLGIAIGTLQTGKLHDETLALIPRIEQRYSLKVEVYEPVAESVVHFVRTNGERAMYQSIELRKACCGIRKLEPLARMLAERSAWVTGLRREQSNTRAVVPFSESDDQGRAKINPLADWSWADVWHYIRLNEVPYNPLHDQFYPSIGCAPCTRAIAVGEDFRAGRWWWENEDAKECGLHVKPHSSDAPASDGSRSETVGGFVSAQADFGTAEVKGSQEAGRSQNAEVSLLGGPRA